MGWGLGRGDVGGVMLKTIRGVRLRGIMHRLALPPFALQAVCACFLYGRRAVERSREEAPSRGGERHKNARSKESKNDTLRILH